MRLLSEPPRVALRVHGAFATKVAGPLRADFSVNLNPYGPSPRVVEAARAAVLAPYPDSTASRVREAIGRRFDRSADEVVFGHGASELFWTFARALLGPTRHAVVVAPAFGEIVAALEASGARLTTLSAKPDDDFAVPLSALCTHLANEPVDAVFLSDPTTPAGRPLDGEAIAQLALRHSTTCFVIDESFLASSQHAPRLEAPMPANVVRVRSLTKEHAVAGVRAGYLLAPAALAQRVEAERAAWSTSTIAQAVALAALDDDAFVARSRERLLAQREALAASLARIGLRAVPSSAPYLVVPVGDARRVHEALAARGILVRDCTSFGMPHHLRLAARPSDDVAILVEALAAIVPGAATTAPG